MQQMESLIVNVRPQHVAELCAILANFPHLTVQGDWPRVTICGSRDDLDAAMPKIAAWQHDCESREAW